MLLHISLAPSNALFSHANGGCHSNCGLKRNSSSKWGIRTFKKWNTQMDAMGRGRNGRREEEMRLFGGLGAI